MIGAAMAILDAVILAADKGALFLPIGYAIQAIALLKTGFFPRWGGILFLIGALLAGFPDGAEIINLTASVLMAIVLVPYSMHIILNKGQKAVG